MNIFEGKTEEEALLAACQNLGVARSAIQYKVIDNGAKGFLGIGAKNVKIEVEIPNPQIPFLKASDQKGLAEAQNRTKIQDFQDQAQKILTDILRFLDINTAVAPSIRGETIHLDVDGNHQLLLGKRGETLDAIQFLINKMLNKGDQEYFRIVVDVNGFRKNREKGLVDLALRLAAKAKQTRKVVFVNPMSSYERRVIHIALEKVPDIRTESEGEGEDRRLKIIPTLE